MLRRLLYSNFLSVDDIDALWQIGNIGRWEFHAVEGVDDIYSLPVKSILYPAINTCWHVINDIEKVLPIRCLCVYVLAPLWNMQHSSPLCLFIKCSRENLWWCWIEGCDGDKGCTVGESIIAY